MKADIVRNNEKAPVEGGIGDPGEAELAGCLSVETINPTDSLNVIEDLPVNVELDHKLTSKGLEYLSTNEDQYLENLGSKRAVENLSQMGFPPVVEEVHLNPKLVPKESFVPIKEREMFSLRSGEEVQDLGINSLWEVVESGSRKIKDPWAKAIDEKLNEGLSNVFSDNLCGNYLEVVGAMWIELLMEVVGYCEELCRD
ncbi:hypothetical protein V6N12_012767 [Hibiscus sabdariffa]|uniref:Uncharacterized protein n=1 Tax=Hibiscus sabdariffa TaxID=183260 RepID=A0ABR2EFC9_9ROSI